MSARHESAVEHSPCWPSSASQGSPTAAAAGKVRTRRHRSRPATTGRIDVWRFVGFSTIGVGKLIGSQAVVRVGAVVASVGSVVHWLGNEWGDGGGSSCQF